MYSSNKKRASLRADVLHGLQQRTREGKDPAQEYDKELRMPWEAETCERHQQEVLVIRRTATVVHRKALEVEEVTQRVWWAGGDLSDPSLDVPAVRFAQRW